MAVIGECDVRRFQITMDDALLMRGLQHFGDLLGNRERLIDGDRPTRDPFVQALAVHEFEHEELRAVGFVDAMNLRDVHMIQRGKDLCFAPEACQAFRIVREGVRQDLQCDFAPELGVAGAVDLAL